MKINHGAAVSLDRGIYHFSEFLPKALALFSTRRFDATKDFTPFLQSLGLKTEQFCTVKQVHGDKVILVEKGEISSPAEADGLISRVKHLALAIRTADCAPVFFLDRRTPAVGICHAGWRGVQKGIVTRTIKMLERSLGSRPSELQIAIGPTICESCYEVGPEFVDSFPGFVKPKDSKFFFDLVGAIKKQLGDLDVSENSISDSRLCTVCSADQFFSARKEGVTTGRFFSAIMLK